MQDLIAWLMTPISGAAEHTLALQVAWHGRLMVLAWAAGIPVAVLLARFYKVTPRQRWPQHLDNSFWWHAHRLINYTALALTLIALVLIWDVASHAGTLRQVHAWMGWTVLASGVAQILGAYLRGSKGGPTDARRAANGNAIDWHGDHYDMTPRRILFERVHKSLGYCAMLLAAVTVLTGLWSADAPRWMWLAIAAWWCVWALMFWRLQSQGRCIDTYQAIWGPGKEHPGNTGKIVGLGVRRVEPLQ